MNFGAIRSSCHINGDFGGCPGARVFLHSPVLLAHTTHSHNNLHNIERGPQYNVTFRCLNGAIFRMQIQVTTATSSRAPCLREQRILAAGDACECECEAHAVFERWSRSRSRSRSKEVAPTTFHVMACFMVQVRLLGVGLLSFLMLDCGLCLCVVWVVDRGCVHVRCQFRVCVVNNAST